jgi:glycerate 2-kinase
MRKASVLIRSIFTGTLELLNISDVVSKSIRCDGSELIVCDRRYDLCEIKHFVIVAAGKAATPMYDAVAVELERSSHTGTNVTVLLIAPTVPRHERANVTFFPGAHPIPNEVSREAAEATLNYLGKVDEHTFVMFLISGGASSMLEAPIDPNISISETAEFYRALVASGLPITEMNVLRKHFSLVKGGRLAVAASRAAAQCTLIVSDVPSHSSDSVGSGPSLPDFSTVQDSISLFERLQARVRLPENVISFFNGPLLTETPKQTDKAFARSFHRVILSSTELAEAATQLAKASGFHVEVDSTCDEWECRDAVKYLLDRTEALARIHPRVCLISVGEVLVQVHGRSGRGGRNQHFVLSCAMELHRRHSRITVLSAGSDGIDGNSPAAGAIADWTTLERARLMGLDAQNSLETFDSFFVFHELGDAIMTGPTGNNLRDVRILMSDVAEDADLP